MIVLDLINKIKNGEDLPYKIKYNGKKYIYNYKCLEYFEENTECIHDSLMNNINFIYELFNKIEIIEENKIIEKINDKKMLISKTNEIIISKINEMIEEINKLIKRGDK